MMLTKEMLSYIAENIEDIKRIIRDLCAIPAPSHHEEKRAEYCKAWFRANGFEDVEIDEALNVVCRYQVTDENDLVVFMAHTDTVFPDTEPMPFREDEKKMYAPGVCDDTANLAVMMVSARYFVQRKLRAKCGLLFVANSCEEGLGNLKGSRRRVWKPQRDLLPVLHHQHHLHHEGAAEGGCQDDLQRRRDRGRNVGQHHRAGGVDALRVPLERPRVPGDHACVL